MELSSVLGEIYFKKALYVLKDFNDPNKTLGIAIQVESNVQRNTLIVHVIGNYNQQTITKLNENKNTFNTVVSLIDPVLNLKNNQKFKIECSAIKF